MQNPFRDTPLPSVVKSIFFAEIFIVRCKLIVLSSLFELGVRSLRTLKLPSGQIGSA
jgi:hypothetical protein